MAGEATRDFPRSEAVTARDLRSLETLHQRVADALGTAFSAVLRCPVEVRLAGVEQFAYGKFVYGLASPSHFSVLKAEPLGDCLMLDIELAILYPMLDRMLGGGHENEPPPRRALSDIELPLAARVARVVLEHLRQAWQCVRPLKFEVLQVESQPRRLRLLPSEEAVAIVGFALTIADRQGMMRLCIPSRAVRQIGGRLSDARSQRGSSPMSASEDATNDAGDAGPRAEVAVTLPAGSIAAGDLRDLRVGDIIVTESDAGSPAILSIDGEPKFQVKPGACQGRKAIVISEPVGTFPTGRK